jgi:hypothetical protein
LENLGVDGRVQLVLTYSNGRGPNGAYWLSVAQDKVKYRAFVNTVMNVLWGIFDWKSDYQLLEKGSDYWSNYRLLFNLCFHPIH